MTQAYNLSQLANNLNASGQLDAADGLVNAVPIVNGGTGATSAATARSNLGLGTLAVANTVSNDVWSGTDLTVANGGTGSSTASGARTNLGVVIGTDVMPFYTPSTSGNVLASNGSTWVSTNLASLAAFNRNLSSSGYQILPGGLIIQWGVGQTFGGGGTVYLPITFPNVFAAVTANNTQAFPSNTWSTSLNRAGTGAFEIYNQNGVSLSYTWIAIGY